MKFFIRFFLVVLLLLALLVGGYYVVTRKGELSARFERSLEAKVDYGHDAPPPPAAAPAATPINYSELLQQAALATGVELASLQNPGPDAVVTIRWRGSNAAKGGEFLDLLINNGYLRDFEQVGNPTMGHNNRGEQVFQATYQLRLR